MRPLQLLVAVLATMISFIHQGNAQDTKNQLPATSKTTTTVTNPGSNASKSAPVPPNPTFISVFQINNNPITVTIDVSQPINCFGYSNGMLTAVTSGGADYTYLWSNGQTTQTAEFLAAGMYSVTVTSGLESAVAAITLQQPAMLTGTPGTPLPALTCAQPNVNATIQVSGGTSPYSYVWANGGDAATTVTSTAGPNIVTITDANGCTIIRSVFVQDDIVVLDAPQIVIVDNVPPAAQGSINAEGCGTDNITEYSLFASGPFNTTAPSYTTVPMTIFARCRNVDSGCISPVVSGITAPTIIPSEIVLECPTNIQVTAATGQTTASVNYPAATSTTTCFSGGLFSFHTSGPLSGEAFSIGTTDVCFGSFDDCGNLKNCCFQVTVLEAPPTMTVNCPANIMVLAPSSASTKKVNFAAPTATSNCPTGDITVTQTSGGLSGTNFALGTHTICYSLSDDCGNTANCCFDVVVMQGTPSQMTISCPPIQEVVAPFSQTGTVVNVPQPTVTTTCADPNISFSQTTLPTNGTTFPIGSSSICFVATDACGNTKACCTKVKVFESTADNGIVANCYGVTITPSSDQITIANIPTGYAVTIQVVKLPEYEIVFNCYNSCTVPTTNITNLDPATYRVRINFYTINPNGSWVFKCNTAVNVNVGSTGSKSMPTPTQVLTTKCSDALVTSTGNAIAIADLPIKDVITMEVLKMPENETVFSCWNTCANPATVIPHLESGDYQVRMKYYDLLSNGGWRPRCHENIDIKVEVPAMIASAEIPETTAKSPDELLITNASIKTPEGDYILYPNPSSTHIWLKYTGQSTDKISYTDAALLDAAGRVKANYLLTNLAEEPIQLPLQALPGGVYYLQLTGNGMTPKMLQMVKNK